MNIDCNKWRELASDYIDGALPDEMQRAVTIHLQGCAKCQQDEVVLRAINRELNVLPDVDPPLFFRENVISTIERTGKRPIGSWWQTIWSGYGRLVVGATLTVSIATAVTFAVMIHPGDHSGGGAKLAATLPTSNIIAGTSTPAVALHKPELSLSRVTVVLPGEGAAWDFSFYLANAAQGTAQFKVGGDDKVYRFQLNGTTPQTLRVPATVLSDKKVLELTADWTAEDGSHNRQMYLPVSVEGEQPVDVRQSFGLPEYNVADLAREITTRYRQAIILDDVPTNITLRLTARDETAEETLQRQLTDLGLTVYTANDGIHVQKASDTTPAKP
jgi:hypothetical protein